MKQKFIAILALVALAAPAFAGTVAPFTVTYSGDPTDVSTTILDPAPGSVIIDQSTTHRAIKLSPKGSNATYAGQLIILSGTFALSGSTGQTTTVANLPANGGTFVFTGANIVCTTGTNVTTAPTLLIQSGTSTILTGTTTVSGTASSKVTPVSPIAATPLVVTGTAVAPIQVKIVTTGTSAGTFAGKAFVSGFWLP